jgi:hypothetical protein
MFRKAAKDTPILAKIIQIFLLESQSGSESGSVYCRSKGETENLNLVQYDLFVLGSI